MPDSVDDIFVRQRQERKDLQAQITKLKRSVGKGDKKRKKVVDAEIAALEENLRIKHNEECRPSCSDLGDSQTALIVDQQTEATNADDISDLAENLPPRISKAQKRRDKKLEKEKERADTLMKESRNGRLSQKSEEYLAFDSQLRSKNLVLHYIAADGDCLYNAIAHQFNLKCMRQTCADDMRQIAASYIRENRDEFLPFLLDDNDSELSFEKYCDAVQGSSGSGAWGGQPEIRAISESLRMPIEVLQVDAPSMIVGNQFDSAPLLITYHKHAYRLGEHYNSTEAKPNASAASAADDDNDNNYIYGNEDKL